jgi:hypothetical protein
MNNDNEKKVSAVKAIRAKCLDCSGNQPGEVRECHIQGCSLWPFRNGHRPKAENAPKRVLSAEHKAKLHAARAAKKAQA